MFLPSIFDDRASLLSRVPSHSGQVVNVTARSTKARMCGCSASTSLDRNDFWIFGISPSYVRLIPSTLILVGSLWSRSCSSFLVYLRIGLSGSKKPQQQVVHPLDIMRVQARGGFIEDIGDVGERGAEVADHLGALCLSPGQGARRPVEREVSQPDLRERVEEVLQPGEQRSHRRHVETADPAG